jgi:hypothetical protein
VFDDAAGAAAAAKDREDDDEGEVAGVTVVAVVPEEDEDEDEGEVVGVDVDGDVDTDVGDEAAAVVEVDEASAVVDTLGWAATKAVSPAAPARLARPVRIRARYAGWARRGGPMGG